MDFFVRLDGAKELEKKLASLESKVSKKVVRKAVRMAQKPVLAKIKANALSMVGGEMGSLLAKNLKLKAGKQKKGSYRICVQIREEVEAFVDNSAAGVQYYIPAAIEFGHDAAAAIPFMRSAHKSTKKTTENIFTHELKLGIDSIAKGK